MKVQFKFLPVLTAFAVALSAGADETFPTLEADGHIYKNVTVTTVTATDIYFTFNGGMGNAKLKDLSPELQKHFQYNAATAAAQEQQQAEANAQYLASQPPQWGTDLPAALNQAASENKLVLMDFTGSDWCPWCIKLDHDVFSTPQFARYAQQKLVLVRVDFPHNTPQSEDLQQANAALASRFGVNGYPTCILLNFSGKELWRQVGYSQGGPDAFTSQLDRWSPISPKSSQFPTIRLAPVASLVAKAVPKLGPKWQLIAGIAAGLLLILLVFRRSGKSRFNF